MAEAITREPRAPARILIAGGGLAAYMTAATLARQLPPGTQITLLECEDVAGTDLFYGSITDSSAYPFNLAAGVSEPRLLLNTNTSFCWGTQIARWGADQRSWMQCFHLPLPVLGGVQLHHYLRRLGVDDLEPFLISAAAARLGAFAHPLEKNGGVLARAEYGYQLDAESYRAAFVSAAQASGVNVVRAALGEVRREDGVITAIRLADGQEFTADLYLDCTGPVARLQPPENANPGARRLRAVQSTNPQDGVGVPYRTLTGRAFGWQSDTALQNSRSRLTVFDAESEAQALAAHELEPRRQAEVVVGMRPQAWVGNCVALGQSACVLEPLSHAPLQLLQRDIERLVSLIPLSADMAMERREFNRQFTDDYQNAALFHRAMFETSPVGESAYWQAARAEAVPERLALKLRQYARRGQLVAFDLEPMSPEDWTILHFGMRRQTARYDRIADREPESELRARLTGMRKEIDRVAASLPIHRDYMARLIAYLRQKKW